MDVDDVVEMLAERFPSFGGGRADPGNPVSMALEDSEPMFAAGVSIREVVEAVVNELGLEEGS